MKTNETRATYKNKIQNLLQQQEQLLSRPNSPTPFNNGLFQRYRNTVISRHHAPVHWRYDFNEQRNPFLMERLGINTTFNAGAMLWKDRFLLFPRVESNDVKSFFAVAESPNGIDNFRFWDRPIIMPQTDDPDMNVYDLRVVEHEDGWIYGLFCTERKDKTQPHDTSAAIAQNGLARTKDLIRWERLPDLVTGSTQQRNCVLHPEFVDGKYAFYTRPMDGFIETGGGGGIGWGYCENIENPVIKKEIIIDPKAYHTVKEVKNGLGPAPIKTEQGWIHLAHGVRRTAAGLRYSLYVFLCDLDEPWKVIRRPGGHLMAPKGKERVGDVSNVLFSNGWIEQDGQVYLYYASSDTRMHVATTSLEQLIDYTLNTPEDAGGTYACLQQRMHLINDNLTILKEWGMR